MRLNRSAAPPPAGRVRAASRTGRRPGLRTRVLVGVVLITLTALVAFDFAAVGALRKYLLSHTDSQLASVLSLYRPVNLIRPPGGVREWQTVRPAGQVAPVGARPTTVEAHKPTPQQYRTIRGLRISGPAFRLNAPIFDQYFLEFLHDKGPLRMIVTGNPSLRPKVPITGPRQVPSAPETVIGVNDRTPLRVDAIRLAGGTLVVTTSLAEVNKTVSRLENILAIASAVAGLLVAAGVALVVRRGLRPIETMAAQADLITTGDLTERVGYASPATEVGRLGAALNGMLARIEASVRERDASQERSRRFFADASHELRNPLASLRANAELYQQGALADQADVDEAMRRISIEAQRMSLLVDDMLRLARLDEHPDERAELVDLTDLLTGCAERAQIADPGRVLKADVAPGLVLTGDEELLRRAVDNMLANVRAHTPSDTVAVLASHADAGGTITIEVSDGGPGVLPDDLPLLFDRFYRAGAQSHRPGSGLGLSIVSAIATAHGGKASAELNEPHGLRVALTLPAARPARVATTNAH